MSENKKSAKSNHASASTPAPIKPVAAQAPANPFVAREEAILKFWDEAEIFKQSLKKDAPNGNFIFFEGPPTANGLPGIHHVLARAFKDVLPRFKTMNGFRVERKAGWDTHGLPVELQVEKELGLAGKPDIEKYGIKEFNQKCQESVWKYTDEWEKMTKRIAFWLDLEKPYVTYENYYMESLWWILKEADKKGLLYKGHKVVPHCPRCGTALSSHEVAQGYKLVKENSVYLKFKITVGNKKVAAGDHILAWTTTPWTLPGNVALAVGEKIKYVLAEVAGENLILAEDCLERVLGDRPYNISSKLKGADLLGLEYEPLFTIPALKDAEGGKNAYKVWPADFVTTADGTGVVHTAVMYGEDDYNLGERWNLPKVHTVDEAGKFTTDLKPFGLDGKFVKGQATEKIILDYLRARGTEGGSGWFKDEMYEHDYPFCWRCDTPLLYYAKNSWFLAMSELKDKLIANNATVNWIPEHIKEGRFGEWLANVKDWAISRERYWGTPLPIWECEACAEKRVIGSLEELGELSGQKANLKSDIHRPEIDDYLLTCSKCGGKMKRVREVFDCWFDSGAMPFAQHHYPFENADLIDKNKQYPAEFICEAIDQTRGWFYTLLAIATLLGKGSPYKNVICLGHINDKFGKKMSKSKGNIIRPDDVISQYGADAVRQHMYTINQPGEGKRYDLDDVKEVFRQNIMLLNNIYKFYEMYAGTVEIGEKKIDITNVLDKWILAKLNWLTRKIAAELNQYHVYEAAREIPVFIDELSTWYLRRSRDRFKAEDVADKTMALATTRHVLTELAKLMAPFMPFLAEDLWQKVSGYNFNDKGQSVHLETWPAAGELKEGEKEIIKKMELARTAVVLGLAKRDEAGIKIRQKLAKITLSGQLDLAPEYLDLIKDELNVEEVVVIDKESDKLEAELDTALTPELKMEGLKRELVRSINMLRKEAKLSLGDRATIYISGAGKETAAAFEQLKADIVKDTLSDDIILAKTLPKVLAEKEIALADNQVRLGLKTADKK